MRKRRIRFWLWMIVILGICCAGTLFQQWETQRHEQRNVIIDMIGDDQKRELALQDSFAGNQDFSVRQAVDICGLILILLGIALLIHAIISWQHRYSC